MKHLIVTGANCGLGLRVAMKACAAGHHVTLACRSLEKGQKAKEQIEQEVADARVALLPLDLSDFKSVRDFVTKFNKQTTPLDILINNAGLFPPFRGHERQLTSDGLEVAMATNHLGPFLLTNLLLPNLKQRAQETGQECRIVMVTSGLTDNEKMKKLDLDDIMSEKEGSYVDGKTAYVHSKLGTIMFTKDLAKKLQGSSVTVNAVCPGFVPDTELSRTGSIFLRFFMKYIMAGFIGRYLTGGAVVSTNEGSSRIYNVAIDEDLKGVSGEYFKNGAQATPNEQTLDEEKRVKLWEISEKYVGNSLVPTSD